MRDEHARGSQWHSRSRLLGNLDLQRAVLRALQRNPEIGGSAASTRRRRQMIAGSMYASHASIERRCTGCAPDHHCAHRSLPSSLESRTSAEETNLLAGYTGLMSLGHQLWPMHAFGSRIRSGRWTVDVRRR